MKIDHKETQPELTLQANVNLKAKSQLYGLQMAPIQTWFRW